MERAIWAIVYDLEAERRAEYLDWFHRVHMPEKLARPGYVSAAHYRLVAADPARRSGPMPADSYLALFGGTSTRVFFDPSLSELKARQDDLTRRMMACRSGAQAFILAEEWREEQTGAGPDAPGIVELSLYEAPGIDEAVGGWCTRELAPLFAGSGSRASLRKLLVAQGPARHAVLAGFETLADRDAYAAHAAETPGAAGLAAALKALPRSPVVGVRIALDR